MLTRRIVDRVDEIHKAKRAVEASSSDRIMRDRLIKVNEAFRLLSEAVEEYAQDVLDGFKKSIGLDEPKNDSLNEDFGLSAVQDASTSIDKSAL
jgi:hypothetical protein